MQQFLVDTALYALNDRHPAPQPAYTYCRTSTTPPQQAVLDYVVTTRALAFTPAGQPACDVRVLHDWPVSGTDHLLVHTQLPCPQHVPRRAARPQPRMLPNTRLLFERDGAHAQAYRDYFFHRADDYAACMAALEQNAANGTEEDKLAAAQAAKAQLLAHIHASVAESIGYVRVWQQPAAQRPRYWNAEVEAAVRAKRAAAAAMRAAPSPEAMLELRAQRRAVSNALRAAQRAQPQAVAQVGGRVAGPDGRRAACFGTDNGGQRPPIIFVIPTRVARLDCAKLKRTRP
jgi:hypothetical protein